MSKDLIFSLGLNKSLALGGFNQGKCVRGRYGCGRGGQEKRVLHQTIKERRHYQTLKVWC